MVAIANEEDAPAVASSAPAVVTPLVFAPPLVVQLLAGNPATAVALLQLLNTVDATALRRLHPVVAVAVETLPWCDKTTKVTDMVRWRAVFPAATGARLARVSPAVAAATLASLTYLDVSGCVSSVKDEVIRLLPPSLRTLDVHDCAKVSGAVTFAHLPALETVDCGGTGVGNSAIATLSPSMRELRANYCCVTTGADFRHLRALRTLTASRLHNGVNLSSSNLPSSLEVLDLVGFGFTPHGAPFAHLATLRTMLLQYCQLPHAELSSLPPSIERLTLVTCTGLGSSTFPHLPKLELLYCPDSDLGDTAIASLPPSLSSVTVIGGATRLTPAASFPPHMPALRDVELSGTAIGDAAIASLPRDLRVLEIQNCISVTPAARLGHLVNLTILRSSGANLAPSTLAACRARGCDASADGILRGHGSNKVLSLAVPPDGTIASGDDGGTVRLWAVGDSSDGAYHAAGDGLAGHGGEVRALVALRDGRRLAAGVCINEQWHNRGSIVLWDIGAVPPTRGATVTFGAGVMALGQLADDHLAVGCDDGRIHVVDATAGVVAGMTGHSASVTALVVLPDGSMVASGSADRTVRLWDVGTRACVATLTPHANTVTALAVLADGKLASGSHDGPVRLWDTASRTCVRELQAFSITSLAALPRDGLVGGSRNGFIDAWNAAGCKREALYGHTRPVTALVTLPGSRLASASEDGTVRLWQLPTSL